MATGGPNSEVIKFGYVEFKSKLLKALRKRWLVLYGGDWSAPRLVKYTDEKHAKQCPEGRHIYHITDIISAERVDGKDNAVKLRFASEEREIFFCCDSDAGATDWVYCIQKCMTGSRDVFNANLFHATHIQARGDVTVRIADVYVRLIKDGVEFLKIPMNTIRKYQMDKDNVFWIETGRSSPTGEGFLYFRSELAQYILTRLHELASRGGERRQSLPSTSTQSPSYPAPALPGRSKLRRPSLPATPNHYVEQHDSMGHSPSPYEAAVTPPVRQYHPGPHPLAMRYPEQTPGEDLRRNPLSQSLGRINEGGETWFRSERYEGDGSPVRSHDNMRLTQSFSGLQRKKSGTSLVKAETRPSLPPGHPSERTPYMQMQNKVNKKVANDESDESDERSPYIDMINPVNNNITDVKTEEFPSTHMENAVNNNITDVKTEEFPYTHMENAVNNNITDVKTEEFPYTHMENAVNNNITDVKTEEFPYTHMENAGPEEILGSNDDYLTPFSTRPDAKHYGEKRNS